MGGGGDGRWGVVVFESQPGFMDLLLLFQTFRRGLDCDQILKFECRQK